MILENADIEKASLYALLESIGTFTEKEFRFNINGEVTGAWAKHPVYGEISFQQTNGVLEIYPSKNAKILKVQDIQRDEMETLRLKHLTQIISMLASK